MRSHFKQNTQQERADDLAYQLETHLLNAFEQFAQIARFSEPTVGIEQEFFVLRSEPKHLAPVQATLSDTQQLLQQLSLLPGWKTIQEPGATTNNLIRRVSRTHSFDRYTAVKYEYPPHLLEIAFAYFENISDLAVEISSVWSDLKTAANNCRLALHLAPFISPVAVKPEDQCAISKKFLVLASSRRALYLSRGEAIDTALVDFPSYTAATQTQVGIPYWWRQTNLIHRLYTLELILLPLLNPTLDTIRTRQHLYESVFRGIPLLGIPALPIWSTFEWARALCDTPIMIGQNSSSPITTMRSLCAANKTKRPEEFLPFARDLQIVRPKSFGTVEFRGDASVTRETDIIKVASLRFGATLLAADQKEPIPYVTLSLPEIRKKWLARLNESVWHKDYLLEANNIYQRICKKLQSRGKGEELFLERPAHE